ncbi:hypothetical protein ACP4OV_020128 [Aristida adscensionis]
MPASMTGKAGGAASEPLLPVEECSCSGAAAAHGGGAASVSGAVFNVSTSIVGAGIMSIPAAMRVLGVVPAVLLTAAVAALANASVGFLLRYSRWGGGGGDGTYAGVMGDAFGRAGAVLLNVCVTFTTLGTLVVYLITIGDVMSGSAAGEGVHAGVLQDLFGAQWWTTREVVLLVTALVVLLPLALRRRVDSLKYTSAVSILLAVVFILISLGITVFAIFRGNVKMLSLTSPGFPHHLSFSQLSQSSSSHSPSISMLVKGCHQNFNFDPYAHGLHPIRAEMKTSSDMMTAVQISVVLCSAIYVAVGFFGFLLFGEATMADVLVNFDQSSGAGVPQALNDLARLSYALHLVLVFPLLNFSLRINVDELLFQGKRQPLAMDTGRFMFLTVVLMALMYALAIAIPSIWTLIQYGGSVFPVSLSLIFPGAIVLRDIQGIAKRKDKALALTMICVAVISSSIAITTNIMSSRRD